MAMVFKKLGVTDETTVCECCGRADLKKTVVLTNGDEEFRYGTECAARALGLKKGEVEKVIRSAEKAAAGETARQEQIARNAAWDAYTAWLQQTYGDTRSDLSRSRAYRATGGTI